MDPGGMRERTQLYPRKGVAEGERLQLAQGRGLQMAIVRSISVGLFVYFCMLSLIWQAWHESKAAPTNG